MVCPYSFPSGLGEKHSYLKEGRDLAPDKLGFSTSSQGGVTDPIFVSVFFFFLSPIPD